MAKKQTIYSESEKQELLAQINELRGQGVTLKDASKELGIPVTTVYGWNRQIYSKRKRKNKPTVREIPVLEDEISPAPGRLFLLFGDDFSVIKALREIV